jgi:hypothetical protein
MIIVTGRLRQAVTWNNDLEEKGGDGVQMIIDFFGRGHLDKIL